MQFHLPKWNIPINVWTTPQANDKKTAYVGSPIPLGEVANAAVIKDIMAVGPSVISLEVPKIVYIKQPMKAEYNPYCI